ncbi:M42 family metallopeptidase [Candidatus Bipolaricaulota bacterium]|nr:M42 family metallopeptidase [Candidatus Bipolaricaulota bacterium]
MELLRQLSEACGVPGYEQPVRAVIADALSRIADEIRVDVLGNLIAHKAGRGPVVLVAAHMDEIGFMVSHIEEGSGFLRLQPLGGFDPCALVAQRVMIHTENGDLPGCIGAKPAHVLSEEDMKKRPKIKDMFVDVGLPAKRVLGQVRVGDTVTLVQRFAQYGDVISGKALDDRAGVFIAIEALRRVQQPACDLYVVGTTQEEVGLRGARAAGFDLNPRIGIALDATLAVDVPGVADHERVTRLGGGVAIKLRDSASISHPGLVRAMRSLAEERGIPHQMEILPRGGTDAGAIQAAQAGAAVVTLSLPVRYVHSVVETAHAEDVEAAISLLAAFLETADQVDLVE